MFYIKIVVILIGGIRTYVSKLYFVNGHSISHGIGKQNKKQTKNINGVSQARTLSI